MDLLVVERDPFGPGRSRRQEIAKIRRAVSAYRIPKDILVFSEEEVAYWADSLNHVIAQCLREGRVLYARP